MVERIVTIPELPWWPPAGYEPMTEKQVRELFAYLRTVVPPVMADAHRRIQARVGDDPIGVWPTTVTSLAGHRWGFPFAAADAHRPAKVRAPRMPQPCPSRHSGSVYVA